MNWILPYRSKKYLQRLALSFSLLVLLLLIVFSAALYYNSEKIVRGMQKEADRKVLSQMKFNIGYMNDVVQKLATSLYYDNDVVPLMTAADDTDLFDTLVKRSRIDKFADYTSFIHSILIYNAKTDSFIWGGDPSVQDRNAPIYANLRAIFGGDGPVPKLKMMPMSLGTNSDRADLFTIFNYEAINYRPGENVFILNIKPQWLFDNIQSINRLAWQENESLFLMEKGGRILTPDGAAAPLPGQVKDAVMQRLSRSAEAGEGSFTSTIDGGKKVVNYLDTGVNDWTLISVLPYETLAKRAASLQDTMILLTAVFIVFALFATLGLSHRLYRPIEKLVGFFRRDAGGEAEPRLESGDELVYMSSVYEHTLRRLETVRNEQRSTRSIVRSYSVRKLVTDGSMTEDQAAELIRQHGLALAPEGPYRLCVLKLDALERDGEPDKERRLLQFALANIAQELLSERYGCETFEWRNELAAAVSPDSAKGIALAELPEAVRIVQKAMGGLYRVTVSAAISDEISGSRGLSEHYRLVQQYMRYTLVFGPQSIVDSATIAPNMANAEAALPPEWEKKLAECVKSGQREAFAQALDKIFAHIATLHHDHIVYMVLHVFLLVKNAIKEMNDVRLVPLPAGLSDIHQKLLGSGSLERMKTVLLGVYDELGENKGSPEQERAEVLVDAIREIIEQHYPDTNLSLQRIGDMMKLSPDFIGRLFKKHQGIAVAEYLNEVRLRHAVRFLENDDYTVNALIEKVGFGTRSNFFRLFKNKYGTTPKEYRIKRSLAP
ncbi:helix-turn-helix domain-containing protein [Cohnella zeiphila]|uniref:AraC family transcriptional regulator n=1 Tax=Cohnella zeiphila TaxID=2761120 RepID=A0A7X0STX8_9BACL|nr:helix-turn-helix domain-containing protein [Cohnella zeiphila]MBB6735926.1 AraC family transcriptional regulator [Cohnella zeiphila]